jgi:hypothetical protein
VHACVSVRAQQLRMLGAGPPAVPPPRPLPAFDSCEFPATTFLTLTPHSHRDVLRVMHLEDLLRAMWLSVCLEGVPFLPARERTLGEER